MNRKLTSVAGNQGVKTALTPKLRFPEFRDAPAWEEKKVGELVSTVTPPKKLPTSSYLKKGSFPIIDQSQREICGWTDDDKAVITEPLPVIVFGDHTCALKFVSQPFAQGADGIKILNSRNKVSNEYLFHFLNFQPIVTEEYKRHFSILQEKKVAYSDIRIGEQQKIAEFLTTLDEVIAAQSQKLDALKTHKKGLMQGLFPQEKESEKGEVRNDKRNQNSSFSLPNSNFSLPIPRLRFPEFQAAPEWLNKPLGELGEIITGKTPSTKESNLWRGDILFITPTDISEEDKYQHTTARTVVETKSTKVLPEGSIVYTCIASIGKMALTVCPSITNQQINAVVPNKKTAGEFVYYTLLNLTPWIKTISAVSTLPIINKTDFSKIAITYPEDKAEQQRIATCLTSLDDLITAQSAKLTALKTHKRGLMQQLFPSPIENSSQI